MSRHTIVNKETGRTVVHGYDKPLGEYFLTEYWKPEESKKIAETMGKGVFDSEVRFSIMSHTTTNPHPDFPGKMDWSNGEILELMAKYPEISPYHRQAIAFDIPY